MDGLPERDAGRASVFDTLRNAYDAFRAATTNPNPDEAKASLAALSSLVQSKDLHGWNSLHALSAHQAAINWQGMAPDAFGCFYRFAFCLCREEGKRNVQADVAVAAWGLVLRGRFRLLDKWCAFVGGRAGVCVVTEDTWRQVLDFSRTVHEDLRNYDPSGAWPVLLDDFVESLRNGQRGGGLADSSGRRPAGLAAGGGSAGRPSSCAWASPLQLPGSFAGLGLGAIGAMRMGPVSPHSGSKRRPVDVDEVTGQLQVMPLASAEGSEAAGGGTDGSESDDCGTGPGGTGRRPRLCVKRVRMTPQPAPRPQQLAGSPHLSGQQQQGGLFGSPVGGAGSQPASPGQPARLPGGFSYGMASPCGLAGASAGAMPHSLRGGCDQLPPMSPAPLHALGGGGGAGPAAHAAKQHQQHWAQQLAAAHQGGSGGAAAYHTLTAAAGHSSSSVNALMQATVTEALGLG